MGIVGVGGPSIDPFWGFYVGDGGGLFYDVFDPVAPTINVAINWTATALPAPGCNSHYAKLSVHSGSARISLTYACVPNEFGFLYIKRRT